MLHDVWHFLVANGAISAAVKFVTMALLGWLVKLVRQYVKQQRKTIDLLRTDTPGGMRDVVDAIERTALASRGPTATHSPPGRTREEVTPRA